MAKVRKRGKSLRRFILENVEQYPGQIGRVTSEHFGITRQAVNRYLRELVSEGALFGYGQTRNRTYAIAPIVSWSRTYQIEPSLKEDLVWSNDISLVFGDSQPENIRDIWNFGFSEMFNNAIDHSGGSLIFVSIAKTEYLTKMLISDDGIGIFKKIQKEKNLLDERHALLELSKGKLTTDPVNHTGEGIFFTSRIFDKFQILSGGVFFSHDVDEPEDWLLESEPSLGTLVAMTLNNDTSRRTKEVYDEFTTDEGYAFSKTVVPVKLAQHGNDKLISRSQAKRLLARVELFKIVVFDFQDVTVIGQAFADEIFRVFANEHPNIELIPINANNEVIQMIHRAQFGVTPQ